MKIEDIRALVTLIEQSKNEPLKKILTDYLAAQLSKESMVPPQLKIEEIKPLYKEELYKMFDKCQVCGLIGAQGYVCNRNDCPTRITCT